MYFLRVIFPVALLLMLAGCGGGGGGSAAAGDVTGVSTASQISVVTAE